MLSMKHTFPQNPVDLDTSEIRLPDCRKSPIKITALPQRPFYSGDIFCEAYLSLSSDIQSLYVKTNDKSHTSSFSRTHFNHVLQREVELTDSGTCSDHIFRSHVQITCTTGPLIKLFTHTNNLKDCSDNQMF